VKLAEGDVLDDALELFHNHQWVEQKPEISALQMAELVPVLAALFQQSRPKAQKRKKLVPEKVDKGSQSQGRTLVYARSGGRCEAGCGGIGQEWHHRKARSLGGRWDASNGMHVCRPCHAWIGEHAIEAGGKGWYLGAREDPSAVPMLRFGVRVYVDDEGGWAAVTEVA
jgi:hypothetical protein